MFGKLPATGDFLSRGLDFEMRDALDAWLSADIVDAKALFGGEFEERWFTAPAWCFVDRDDDGRWSGGALCASMDAAGRKFPAMIAAPANDAGEAVAEAGGCLAALHCALGSGWTADQLLEAPVAPASLDWRPDGPAWAMLAESGPPVVSPGRFPRGIVTLMLEFAA